MKRQNRPDTIIYIMAYLFILGTGAILGGLVILVNPFLATLQMGSFFYGVAWVLALSAILSIVLGIVFFVAMSGQWRGTPSGRALTLILAMLMALISVVAVPVLLMYDLGSALYLPLTAASLLLLTSIWVLWALGRPHVKAYFSI